MALGWGMSKKGAPFAPCFFVEVHPKQGGPGEKRGSPTLSARFRLAERRNGAPTTI